MILLAINKLRSFKKRILTNEEKARKFWIEVGGIPENEVDDYMKKIMEEFRKFHQPANKINYRFNQLPDEDIYLFSRKNDNEPANIETCPPDFRILGSDTEIYIPDRGR